MQQSNKRTTTVKAALVLMLLLAIPTTFVLAGRGGGPAGLGDPSVPIDGGISLLVAAGIGYGAKKVRDARKKSARQPGNKQ